MATSWRKRKKILPGITLNLTTKGISATIGNRVGRLTIGTKGTTVSTSLPGTGLHSSHTVGRPSASKRAQLATSQMESTEEVNLHLFRASVKLFFWISFVGAIAVSAATDMANNGPMTVTVFSIAFYVARKWYMNRRVSE